ncbi:MULTISPECIES: FimV/HubP family polar landmark protein [Psychrobacter]|uniref:FimV/HubP family polar landmark protein n=1 Tax=Psychrobacter TaxID=497 RepID=UPI000EDE0780|nr:MULTISPECIES: FimV/HubP family polar landmark protein [Psychrobacter]HCT73963.1 pilus assembly protein FimV [Psychrobacter sp.]
MDNMLYIIAGLVLILIVAGLLLYKKKAQKPSAQPGMSTATPAPMPKKGHDTPAQSHRGDDNKFDHITIAQRFMDQQRYDKAIETLNRGLSEKPNDGPLSVKLLSIYATINQLEDFNKVYDAIKTQSDPKSLALADELKTLFSEEQNQIAAKEAPVEDNSNFESIDFDLPINQVDSKNAISEQPTSEDNRRTLIDDSMSNSAVTSTSYEASLTSENIEDNFDLTLSDLESNINAPEATDTAPVTSLEMVDDESLNTANIDITSNDVAVSAEDNDFNDLSDFDFSLDSPEETDAQATDSVISDRSDSINDEMTLDDDAFILDFDDLATDVDKDIAETAEELSIDAVQNDEENDFALSLDSLDAPNTIETSIENEAPAPEENSDTDNFIIEDSGVEEDRFEIESFEIESFENINLEAQSLDNDDSEHALAEESSVTPTAPLLFDDHALLDNEFDTHSSTALSPVAPIEDESTLTSENAAETAEDFSSRFAADFDFVKSLDSNQVTLDLAGQYLQLGEYDSAKRLLNEVLIQGTSEQQNQAQVLLDRTA